MSFHGVIPGKKAESLGQIALDVVFSDSKNYRKEKLTFEVVDFQSAYHAILCRPAYARFMARPCYVYLKLKMPGPKGVITITGNRKKAEECFQKGSKIADAQTQLWNYRSIKKTQIRVICCEPRSLPRVQHSSHLAKQSRFTFTQQIPMLLRLTFRQHSTPNRKKRSSSSSVRTGTSLHGSLLTCRVFPGIWLSIVCESTRR